VIGREDEHENLGLVEARERVALAVDAGQVEIGGLGADRERRDGRAVRRGDEHWNRERRREGEGNGSLHGGLQGNATAGGVRRGDPAWSVPKND
jgi:hypothetical protein